jgi:hypothetical protein
VCLPGPDGLDAGRLSPGWSSPAASRLIVCANFLPKSRTKANEHIDTGHRDCGINLAIALTSDNLNFLDLAVNEYIIDKSLIDDSEQSDRAESAPRTGSSPQVEIDFP